MKIRLADVNDAAVLASLNRKFNKTQDTPEQVAARIESEPLGEIALVAEVEETVVGFACLRVTRSICYDAALAELTELYVDEAHRRKGVGRALVEYAEKIAFEQKAESLMLLTNGKNLTAQEFYRSLGYRVSGGFGVEQETYRNLMYICLLKWS